MQNVSRCVSLKLKKGNIFGFSRSVKRVWLLTFGNIFEMVHSRPLFHLFSVFSNKQYKFKTIVHLVSGAGFKLTTF